MRLLLFMDSLLELKRVHIERAKEITHVLIKIIRDFCFFDRDKEKNHNIDNLLNQLDKLDDDYNNLSRLADTIVFE